MVMLAERAQRGLLADPPLGALHIVAGVYGLAGNEARIDNNYPYTHSSNFFDVTSGSNGTCPTAQWCTARTGWDGPTGLGTPNGSGGF